MVEMLNNSLLKIIGSVDTTEEYVINGVSCLKNNRGTVLKVDNLDDAKLILGEEFANLDNLQ